MHSIQKYHINTHKVPSNKTKLALSRSKDPVYASFQDFFGAFLFYLIMETITITKLWNWVAWASVSNELSALEYPPPCKVLPLGTMQRSWATNQVWPEMATTYKKTRSWWYVKPWWSWFALNMFHTFGFACMISFTFYNPIMCTCTTRDVLVEWHSIGFLLNFVSLWVSCCHIWKRFLLYFGQ